MKKSEDVMKTPRLLCFLSSCLKAHLQTGHILLAYKSELFEKKQKLQLLIQVGSKKIHPHDKGRNMQRVFPELKLSSRVLLSCPWLCGEASEVSFQLSWWTNVIWNCWNINQSLPLKSPFEHLKWGWIILRPQKDNMEFFISEMLLCCKVIF